MNKTKWERKRKNWKNYYDSKVFELINEQEHCMWAFLKLQRNAKKFIKFAIWIQMMVKTRSRTSFAHCDILCKCDCELHIHLTHGAKLKWNLNHFHFRNENNPRIKIRMRMKMKMKMMMGEKNNWKWQNMKIDFRTNWKMKSHRGSREWCWLLTLYLELYSIVQLKFVWFFFFLFYVLCIAHICSCGFHRWVYVCMQFPAIKCILAKLQTVFSTWNQCARTCYQTGLVDFLL